MHQHRQHRDARSPVADAGPAWRAPCRAPPDRRSRDATGWRSATDAPSLPSNSRSDDGAEVILHVARALDLVGLGRAALELVEDRAVAACPSRWRAR
ncbi:MAG: hypothetical protein MZV49_03600 [Rhodopseudomonas palustris]|nr:hypothetical protein [Rhodopseudomonas palustris]